MYQGNIELGEYTWTWTGHGWLYEIFTSFSTVKVSSKAGHLDKGWPNFAFGGIRTHDHGPEPIHGREPNAPTTWTGEEWAVAMTLKLSQFIAYNQSQFNIDPLWAVAVMWKLSQLIIHKSVQLTPPIFSPHRTHHSITLQKMILLSIILKKNHCYKCTCKLMAHL